MGNSSKTVQNLVDIARAMTDVAPTLPVGGEYEVVALSCVNDAITEMLAGSSRGSPFNFKFNRILIPAWFVNSYQQDYAQNNLNIGWLESAGAYNTSSTQQPKPYRVLEVKRDVLLTNAQTGQMAKVQWLANKDMQYAMWGQSVADSLTGLSAPGPGVTYTDPMGMPSTPSNPCTQVTDAFGNFWALTTYGTCGNTNPFVSNQNPNDQYPTIANPTQTPITVTDGGVVWTAINPDGQGFRLNPMPTQTGPVWQVAVVAQQRIPQFTDLQQYLEPIPDDFFKYLKDGFFCYCYAFHPDPKMVAKFDTKFKLWMKSLDRAVSQGSREEDDWGFVPSTNVMDTGWAFNPVNPAMPYGPWAG